MRRFRSPITRLNELRRQQVRMAEFDVTVRLAEHRAAVERLADAQLRQETLQYEITECLTATRSVAGHIAGTTALEALEIEIDALTDQQRQAAARLDEALAKLHQARADEQLMSQLHERQLKRHRQETLRREEHVQLETALALRHSSVAPADSATAAESFGPPLERPSGSWDVGLDEEDRRT